jgi:hypothetical protein
MLARHTVRSAGEEEEHYGGLCARVALVWAGGLVQVAVEVRDGVMRVRPAMSRKRVRLWVNSRLY